MTDQRHPERTILLVDDEADWLNVLSLLLESAAEINNVEACLDSRDVLEKLAVKEYSLILLDLNMPHLTGEQLLPQIKESHPDLPVIILSGMNQIEKAVDCIKLGAEDYFVKTDPTDRLVARIEKVLKNQELRDENRQLANRLLLREKTTPPAFTEIITCSEKMRAIFAYLSAIAKSHEPVLVTGESGVGKELIVRALHKVSCPEAPLVAVNVAGLDDTVFTDTLFGHLRGAFTGADKNRPGMIEKANGGILFLDEIGDLSMSSQVKLLRLLQEKEYYPLGGDQAKKSTARVVVATNQNLEEKETSGAFRRDLRYRLWSHQVNIPPLRKRKEDLALLLEHFIKEAAAELGKSAPTPPRELVKLLETYNFPGNIRELRAMVYDAVSLHKKGVLSTARFKELLPNFSETGTNHDAGQAEMPEVQFGDRLPTLKQVGKLLVSEALDRAKGNQTIAAGLLGISHQALSKRLKQAE